MSAKHLGRTIDIHAGGQDLVFPHHENELAQSTCAHGGAPFARYWLHNGFLSLGNTKMSKSLGNVLLVHDLVKTIPGETIRLALLNAHYRQPLYWSDETTAEARRMLDRLYGALRDIEISTAKRSQAEPSAAVIDALEDDLNTPKALAEMFGLARRINKAEDRNERLGLALELLGAGDVVGLLQADPEAWFAGTSGGERASMPAEEIERLIALRDQARTSRDFAAADAIRDELSAAGIAIEDGPSGSRWRRTE
jgi:cysteinyl-tRNA synthetase